MTIVSGHNPDHVSTPSMFSKDCAWSCTPIKLLETKTDTDHD